MNLTADYNVLEGGQIPASRATASALGAVVV
jgi:hypothetical protein